MQTNTDNTEASGGLKAPEMKQWRKWLKANKTNEMVWPFNAWEAQHEEQGERNDALKMAIALTDIARGQGDARKIALATLSNVGGCKPFDSDDLLRESNHKLGAQVANLARLLGKAWQIGADHRKPSFDQLNEWREAIAKSTR